MEHSTYSELSELPKTIPVFPLGALLFPRWQLPLNVFEPRYLNMFDDAMASDKLIGIVQSFGGERAHPNLATVGCVGEITSFSETDDGRYQVILTGIVRYGLETELDMTKPYRQVNANYAPFSDDMQLPSDFNSPTKEMVIEALKPYAKAQGLTSDWDAIAEADMESLISALSAGCPFSAMEKQALLEATDLQDRTETLIQLMRMNTGPSDSGTRLQ